MQIRNRNIIPPPAFAYGLGAGLAGVAFIVSFLVGPAIQPNVFPVFLPAIFLCAWYAGWRSAILSTILSSAALYYLFSIYVSPPAANLHFRIALFLASSLGLSWVAVLLKREKMIMGHLQRLSSRLLKETNETVILKEILSAGVAWLDSNRGYAQLYDDRDQALRIVSSVGYGGDLDRLSAESKAGDSVSARALERRERILTAEAQATPLCGRDGQLLGMITTYFARPRRISRGELKLLDLLSRMAEQMLERVKDEEALRSSEERFRLMVESVPDYAIFMLDADGLVSSWNLGAERIKGYRADKILGRHFSEFYPEEDRKIGKPAEELRLALANGRLEAEGWRVRKDGGRFWAGIILTPLREPSGKLRGFSNVTRDLTRRLLNEERARLVVESAPNAILMVNPAGEIVMVNAQAEKLFGFARQELIGKSMEILVPERFRARHPGFRQGFLAAPEARPMGGGRDLYALRKDGTEVPVEIALNPIQTDEGTMVLSSIVDITERKRLQEKFRLAVEAAPNGMIMVNREGHIVLANSQAETMFGYKREELLGRSIELLVPERFRSRHSGFRNDFFAGPTTRPMGAGRDLFGLRKDGREFPVEIGLNPIETGEGVFVLSSIVDITERKQIESKLELLNRDLEKQVRERTALAEARAQKLQELAAALTEAEQKERRRLAQILHDNLQQTLIAAKFSLGRLMQRGRNTPMEADLLQTSDLIQESIQTSRNLTVELSPPILRDAEFLAVMEWLVRWVNEKHHLAVRIDAHPDLPQLNEEVKTFLFQAVREVLFNIVKHAHTSEATMSLAREKGAISIQIEDRGKGFDPKALAQNSAGGFGLFNIRERLEMLNGRMEIQSRPAHGTRIKLTAPISPAKTEAEPPAESKPPRPAAGKQPGAIRVLIVDDHEILRQGLIRLLEEDQRIEIVGEAEDGEDACDKTRALMPDIVVMDITMPRMNGIDATRLIKTQMPSVKVIGLSLHDSEDMLKTMRQAGAEAYLHKNGPIDLLLKKILELSAPAVPEAGVKGSTEARH